MILAIRSSGRSRTLLEQCHYGIETESFEQALELEPTRLSAGEAAFTLTSGAASTHAHCVPGLRFFQRDTLCCCGGSGGGSRRGRPPGVRFLDVDPDVELSPPSPANVALDSALPSTGGGAQRAVGMIATLKRLVPYSTGERLGELINRLEPPAIRKGTDHRPRHCARASPAL